MQGPSDVFGQQYSGDGDCSFNRIGSPICRHDRGHGSSGDTARRRDVSGERDVLSRSEKWLPAPPVPGTNTWRDRETEITGFFQIRSVFESLEPAGIVQDGLRRLSKVSSGLLR